MSNLPGVNMQILDGSLGVSAPNPARSQVKLGVCPGGAPNSLWAWNNSSLMEAQHGRCATIEAAAQAIAEGGGPVFVMPVLPSVAGDCGSVSRTGTGLATVAASAGPHKQITITITKTGNRNAGEFTYQVGTGPVSAAILIPSDGVYRVPGTFCTVTFTSMSFTATDVYLVTVLGTVTKAASPSTDITHVSSPLDDYQVTVEVMLAGALGAAKFRWSLDAASGQPNDPKGSFSDAAVVPAGGVYAIPDTGVVLTFSVSSGNFVLGDLYDFNTVSPSFSVSDYNAAMTALLAISSQWGFIHVVNPQHAAAGAAALAAAVETKMVAAQTAFRHVRTIIETPTTGSITNNAGSIAVSTQADADQVSAFAAFLSTLGRTLVCAGDVLLQSALSGRFHRRNLAWSLASRLGATAASKHPGEVAAGPMVGVRHIYRDEFATELLDASRFTTCRTFIGKPGFYITRGRTMAALTSDYTEIQRGRVMDLACGIVYSAELDFVNKDVRVDETTGYIDERDAQRIEAAVNSRLRTGLGIGTEAADAVSSYVILDRTSDILSTNNEPVEVRVLPKAYLSTLSTKIGFINPALA